MVTQKKVSEPEYQLPVPMIDGVDGDLNNEVNQRFGGGLTRRRQKLVEQMFWSGFPRDAAAKASGMTVRGARMALKAPGVMAYYRQQLALLRETERPRSLHRIAELRDGAESEKVSLEAAKTLAHEPTESRTSFNMNVMVTPGYIVQIDPSRMDRVREILKQAGSTKHVDLDKLGGGHEVKA